MSECIATEAEHACEVTKRSRFGWRTEGANAHLDECDNESVLELSVAAGDRTGAQAINHEPEGRAVRLSREHGGVSWLRE